MCERLGVLILWFSVVFYLGCASAETGSSLDEFKRALQGLSNARDDLLHADDAFRLTTNARNHSSVTLSWQIADGYYLYREKFKVAVVQPSGVVVGPILIPAGEPKEDEAFGRVEVFHQGVEFDVPIVGLANGHAVQLEIRYQGCADRGVCYPPITKTVLVDLPSDAASSAAISDQPSGAAPTQSFADGTLQASEQDRIADSIKTQSLGATAWMFLGFGVLLSLTPCVFPMIPIVTGIVAGHGNKTTGAKGFLLALSYVVASALTYTLFGVLAGLFGANLQAWFQNPWILAGFSGVFVLLALSMFGVYELQMPAFVQTWLSQRSAGQRGGTFWGAAVMGALSALIVGPCVAAPLAGALLYIGQTGDAVLGGVALFALGMGMGVPLLVIGASAGRLLPKAGRWMEPIRHAFGVGLLAVAVWLLSRIVPGPAIMVLWALLLIVPAIYLGALEPLPESVGGWRKLWKGIGVSMLAYGVLLLVGFAAGSQDPLQPVRELAKRIETSSAATGVTFRTIRNLAELDAAVATAGASGRWTVLDFYADWCISCKEMDRYTFSDPNVMARMNGMVLLRVDVTANNAEDQALLRRFGLVGPPATVFFAPNGNERKALRLVGYLSAEKFIAHLELLRS